MCIAGHRTTGALVASSVADSRSPEIPEAYAPISFAVAGATNTRSASCPSVVCGIGSSSSHRDDLTGSDAKALNVTSPTNFFAAAVMIGETNAPASTSLRLISIDL